MPHRDFLPVSMCDNVKLQPTKNGQRKLGVDCLLRDRIVLVLSVEMYAIENAEIRYIDRYIRVIAFDSVEFKLELCAFMNVINAM